MPKDKANETEQESDGKAIAIDSDEREGNDPQTLVGSGAPFLKVQAVAGVLGLAAGETTTLVQSEEVRLLIQRGLLSVVDG